MPSNQVLDTLVSEYYLSRPNLDIPHPAFSIFFFACSGSGKSTTRRLLVERLKATYVCNDEVRLLLERYPEATRQGIDIKAVVAETIKKILANARNKLIIYDNNIIRYYMHDDSYLSVAKANHLPTFIIGLEAPEKELERRIKKRGVNVEQILGELPDQIRDYTKATKDIAPDWIIKTTGDNDELDILTQRINAIVST